MNHRDTEDTEKGGEHGGDRAEDRSQEPGGQGLEDRSQEPGGQRPEVRGQGTEKADFPELKEKHVKDLLAASTWRHQRAVLLKARQLQAKIGTAPHDDFNGFADALAATGLKLDASEKKQITAAVSWKNPAAARVVKKLHKTGKPDPMSAVINRVLVDWPPGGRTGAGRPTVDRI